MNGLPIELLVILCGAGVVALAWFLLRFGRVLARAALAAGGLALAIILALAVLQNATTAKRAVTVATVASAGAAGASGVALLLGAMLVAALVVIGYLVVKVKLVERGTLLPKRKKRKRLPDAERAIYVVEDEDTVTLADLVDLADWGW